jgi:hypothetical protein
LSSAAQGDGSLAPRLRGLFRGYVRGLVGFCLALGVLHVLFGDVRAGGVPWFDLDKERNVATWFSGLLFFLFGCSALLAWALETRRNSTDKPVFRLPFLWLGIAVAGLYMSLDEITILHENLFWREIRVASSQRGDAWKYVTQWQIVFAPAILLGVGYFVVFFSNRFGSSQAARRMAWSGIGCWMLALLLEGVRGTFIGAGDRWYDGQVVIEELLEMLGAIFLLSAVVSYLLDIGLDLSKERIRELARAERWLNRQALAGLGISGAILLVSAGAVFTFATRQAAEGAPVPGLFRRALAEQPPPEGTSGRVVKRANLPDEAAPDVWVEDLPGAGDPTAAPDAAEAERLTDYLFGRPAAIGAETAQPSMAFVSLGSARAPVRTFLGTGNDLPEAVGRAAVAAGFTPSSGQWVRLDVVGRVDGADKVDFRPPLEMELGLDGLAFERRSGIVLLPGELRGRNLIDGERAIQPRPLLDYLNAKNPEWGRRFVQMVQPGVANPYRFFSTRGFILEGDRLVPLYRGHRHYPSVDPGLLRSSAERGGAYLVQATGPDGRFEYSFDPSTDQLAASYNMLRHAGTIYSMLEVYEQRPDAELLAAIERSTEFLVANVRPCPERERFRCVVDTTSVKLGGNALAVIALIKHAEVTGNDDHDELISELAHWMRDTQGADGEFKVHKQAYPEGVVDGFISAYYPGEAILALVRASVRFGDASLLESASNAAHWLITVRDGGLPPERLNHDHWLLYALNDLYREDPNPIYLTHSRKIVETIVNSQNREPKFADWLGSYYDPPRSTPTAIRTEGLAAAWALLRDHGDAGETGPIREAILLGLRFQLQTQIGPESAMYYARPAKALGGFQRSLTESEIRIDYVQHNISALLAGAAILESGE